MPLVLAGYLVWATRHTADQDDVIVAEFLVADAVAEHPLLLGPPPKPGLLQLSQTANTEPAFSLSIEGPHDHNLADCPDRLARSPRLAPGHSLFWPRPPDSCQPPRGSSWPLPLPSSLVSAARSRRNCREPSPNPLVFTGDRLSGGNPTAQGGPMKTITLAVGLLHHLHRSVGLPPATSRRTAGDRCLVNRANYSAFRASVHTRDK